MLQGVSKTICDVLSTKTQEDTYRNKLYRYSSRKYYFEAQKTLLRIVVHLVSFFVPKYNKRFLCLNIDYKMFPFRDKLKVRECIDI